MHAYLITDSQPLLEKVVIDAAPIVSAFNPDNGAQSINCYFGGPCYPISRYEVEFTTPLNQLWRFWVLSDIASAVGNPTVTASNKNQIADNIRAALLFAPGIEADVEITHDSFGSQSSFKLIIDTNAPIGEIKFRNASGNFNDPNNIEVTGFTKV